MYQIIQLINLYKLLLIIGLIISYKVNIILL